MEEIDTPLAEIFNYITEKRVSDIFIAYRCPGGRNTLLRAMSDPDFQYTAKSKKPLYIYISVRDFHSLVKIDVSPVCDVSPVEEIECQRFS